MAAKKSASHHPHKHQVHHVSHVQHTPHTNVNIDKALVDNFVALQKVMTDMASRFDELSNNISKLLEIFETSAKSLSEKDVDFDKNNSEINSKLDKILDQNKTLSRNMSMFGNRNNVEEM